MSNNPGVISNPFVHTYIVTLTQYLQKDVEVTYVRGRDSHAMVSGSRKVVRLDIDTLSVVAAIGDEIKDAVRYRVRPGSNSHTRMVSSLIPIIVCSASYDINPSTVTVPVEVMYSSWRHIITLRASASNLRVREFFNTGSNRTSSVFMALYRVSATWEEDDGDDDSSVRGMDPRLVEDMAAAPPPWYNVDENTIGEFHDDGHAGLLDCQQYIVRVPEDLVGMSIMQVLFKS